MKTLTLALIVLFIGTGISANAKSNEKEMEAIKKVISESTSDFQARDFNKIATTYVQDESVVKTAAAKGGFAVNYGWDKVAENYKNSFKNNPDPVSGKFEKVNFKIKVYKESAWAVHDEIWHGTDGSKFKSVITHFLEKHDGQWKVVYMANIRASSWDVEEEAAR